MNAQHYVYDGKKYPVEPLTTDDKIILGGFGLFVLGVVAFLGWFLFVGTAKITMDRVCAQNWSEGCAQYYGQ